MTERQTDRERETDRQTGRQRNRKKQETEIDKDRRDGLTERQTRRQEG